MFGLLAVLCACSRTRGADPSVTSNRPGEDGDVIPAVCAPCDDGLYCTGRESCDVSTLACLPAKDIECDDQDECTIDSCNERDDRCDHVPMPRDEDRDGFDACEDDCDDQEPRVHPGAIETCDGIDEVCDARTDEGLRSV
jgi:hypothetical protein